MKSHILKNHSTLGPLRYGSVFFKNEFLINKNTKIANLDSARINYRVGLSTLNHDMMSYLFLHFKFKNNFYLYLYPRIVSNVNAFERFTGIPRPKKRFGFNAGEVDVSGIGYENNWLLLQFGRGRQVWSAGESLGLVLNGNSSSYDHILVGTKLGKFKTKFFHGFLERVANVNRYISGRAIEWSNKRSLIIGFSEICVYSGINRPIDISYFNPINSHIELELNDRANELGESGGNGIWQVSLDYLALNNLLFSMNFSVDELTLDKDAYSERRDNGLGISGQLSWTKHLKNEFRLNLNCLFKYVSTHNLRHSDGYNNFVNRGIPLGDKLGSDFINYSIGMNYFRLSQFFMKINLAYHKIGENSIINSPYKPNDDYSSGSFPSGLTVSDFNLDMKMFYKIKSNINFKSNIMFSNLNSGNVLINIKTGIEIFIKN